MNEKPNEDKIKASPAARRIAKELGIDLTDVAAASSTERIQLEDVQQYHTQLKQHDKQTTPPPAEISEQDPTVDRIEQQEESTEEEEILVFDMEKDDPPDTEETVSEPSVSDAKETVVQKEINETEPTEKPSDEIETDSHEEKNETELSAAEVSLDELSLTEEDAMTEPLSKHDDAKQKEHEIEITEPIKDRAEELAIQDCCCEDNAMFLPAIPLSISFEVSDENIRAMLAGLSIPLEDGLIPTVFKAAASAFETTGNTLYEGRMNLIEYEDGEFIAQTITDAQSKKISEMDYDSDEEEIDIPINIWDMSQLGFSKFSKTDTDQLNLFVLRKSDRILIDMTCDEYIMDVTEATAFMHQLKLYMENLAYMLL